MATLTSSSVLSSAISASAAASASISAPPPQTLQPYELLERHQTSPDSCVLRFALPESRSHLGIEPQLPTCIKVQYDPNLDDSIPKEEKTEELTTYSKSYSPISHPSTPYHFDLLVKSYPYTPGGGVGAYLCNLSVGHSITAAVKSPRLMHGSPEVLTRDWTRLGLIAGGTGIAPLYQILKLVLGDTQNAGAKDMVVQLLSINRYEEDILLKDELDALAKQYPDRFSVTYSLTGVTKEEHLAVAARGSSVNVSSDGSVTSDTDESTVTEYEYGRGSLDMIQRSLPPPTSSFTNTEDKTMILICGKDGFVETWAGPVMRAPPTSDGKKGPKIQGPLQGLLKEAGYDASDVFKY